MYKYFTLHKPITHSDEFDRLLSDSVNNGWVVCGNLVVNDQEMFILLFKQESNGHPSLRSHPNFIPGEQ